MHFIKEKIVKLSSNFLRYSLNLPENSSIIILSGGLGNQLFQYSLGLHLEKKFDKNIFFYDSSPKFICNIVFVKIINFSNTSRRCNVYFS